MKTTGSLPSTLTTNPPMEARPSNEGPRLNYQRTVCSQSGQPREERIRIDAGDSGILPPLQLYGELDRAGRLG